MDEARTVAIAATIEALGRFFTHPNDLTKAQAIAALEAYIRASRGIPQ